MMIVTRKIGERIRCGDVEIVVTATGPTTISLGITAPQEVRIERLEPDPAFRAKAVSAERKTAHRR